MRNAISLCNQLGDLNNEVVNKTDLIHMLDATRLLRKMHFSTNESARSQELTALKPMVMTAVNKVNAKLTKGKAENETINITTSAMPSRTALFSFRSSQKSISAALGLSKIEKSTKQIMENNINAYLNAGHTKHLATIMGIKGAQGIDKKDVKGTLKKYDPIYQNIVDTAKTNRIKKSSSSILSKLFHRSKNNNYKLPILLKIAFFIVTLPVYATIKLYDIVIDAIKGNFRSTEVYGKCFECTITPQSEERRITMRKRE